MTITTVCSDKPGSRWTLLSRRQVLIGGMTLAGGIVLAACSPSPSNKTYWVVFIAGIQGAPFYNMIKKGVQHTAAASGNVTALSDAPVTWDANLQTQLVNASIAKGVDAIIIAPTDSEELIAPLKRANDAGIVVVTVDTFLGTGNYTTGPVTFPLAAIGSDNVKGGKIAGEALIKTIGGSGKVYLQNNTPGASTALQRAQGFKEAIAATNGAVQLVAENFDDGDIAKATAQTSAILQAHPDIVGVFGADLYSARGAAAAVKNAQKSGMIKVAQFDAPQQAIIDLRHGLIDLVIAQKPFDMGRIAAEYAITAITGPSKNLPRQVVTGFLVVTSSNMDTPAAQSAIYQ